MSNHFKFPQAFIFKGTFQNIFFVLSCNHFGGKCSFVEENSLNILHRREAAGRVIDMDGLDWTLEMINICIFLSLSLIIRRF